MSAVYTVNLVINEDSTPRWILTLSLVTIVKNKNLLNLNWIWFSIRKNVIKIQVLADANQSLKKWIFYGIRSVEQNVAYIDRTCPSSCVHGYRKELYQSIAWISFPSKLSITKAIHAELTKRLQDFDNDISASALTMTTERRQKLLKVTYHIPYHIPFICFINI
jgi:hypothetical protein